VSGGGKGEKQHEGVEANEAWPVRLRVPGLVQVGFETLNSEP